VTVADRKEVLMKRLADVWSENEVVLILLVDIVDREAFAGGVCKPGDDIGFGDLRVLYALLLLQFVGRLVLRSADVDLIFLRLQCQINIPAIVVINSLIFKRGRSWHAGYQTLYWPCHRIGVHRQLILNQRTRMVRGGRS
jgi:hypothetical protein